MPYKMETIAKLADKLAKKYKTRNPYELAEALGIVVRYHSFKNLKGVYKIINKVRFVILNNDLKEYMAKMVLWHEIGHDSLHRNDVKNIGSFKEFVLFDMSKSRMEYEANIFAAQLALSDEEVLEYISYGYDIAQIANAMESDINLVALKTNILINRGYDLKQQDYKSNFLKY